MIVNGKHQFVGSSRSEWQKALEKESNTTTVSLEVNSIELSNNSVSLTVNVPKSSAVNVAIVEEDLNQEVNKGENRGRLLSNDNVVRSFQSKTFEGEERFKLSFPSEVDVSKSSVIVYAQSVRNWHVIGAEKIDLNAYQ